MSEKHKLFGAICKRGEPTPQERKASYRFNIEHRGVKDWFEATAPSGGDYILAAQAAWEAYDRAERTGNQELIKATRRDWWLAAEQRRLHGSFVLTGK
jgi:hypothetical protein